MSFISRALDMVKKISVSSIIYIAVGAVVISLIILAAYLYRDYKRHRAPLAQADPTASYNFIHHIKLVTIPLMRYRVSLKLEPKTHHISHFGDGIHP